jgi:formylglycine-generating enzyme required for sulfatase activity
MAGSSHGGITRSGSWGNFTYSVITGREQIPVIHVSFWDALRFVNWLHNGQPTGMQDDGTTEDAAYTITPEGIADNLIARNGGATIFLPSEDEWYKAAYYNAVSNSYFQYPTGSETQPTCATPGATPNTANCNLIVGDLTDVGSYTGSASPSGSLDQGGNVQEWTERRIGLARAVRGGTFVDDPSELSASIRHFPYSTNESSFLGFRVAMIPEPTTALLLATGLAGLAAVGRRRA